jgi:hypothetical protein
MFIEGKTMKDCPSCNRTYADDSLTFCLVDGAILSAPYDLEATQRMPNILISPPKTSASLVKWTVRGALIGIGIGLLVGIFLAIFFPFKSSADILTNLGIGLAGGALFGLLYGAGTFFIVLGGFKLLRWVFRYAWRN